MIPIFGYTPAKYFIDTTLITVSLIFFGPIVCLFKIDVCLLFWGIKNMNWLNFSPNYTYCVFLCNYLFCINSPVRLHPTYCFLVSFSILEISNISVFALWYFFKFSCFLYILIKKIILFNFFEETYSNLSLCFLRR